MKVALFGLKSRDLPGQQLVATRQHGFDIVGMGYRPDGGAR
jgi:hypothetical protein